MVPFIRRLEFGFGDADRLETKYSVGKILEVRIDVLTLAFQKQNNYIRNFGGPVMYCLQSTSNMFLTITILQEHRVADV